MTQTAKFTIYIEPKPCQRPQFNTKHGNAYTPAKTMRYQDQLRYAISKELNAQGWQMSNKLIDLYVKFYFKRPKNKTWKTKPMPAYRLGNKRANDVDNLLKNVMDSMNLIAFEDDGQVTTASVEKWVCGADDLRPRIEILIKEWLE